MDIKNYIINNKNIKIYVIPGSKIQKIELDPLRGLLIKVKEKPNDGHANDAIIKYFKKEFALNVKIVKGLTSREKILSII